MKPEIILQNSMPDPVIRKNDKVAKLIIVILSVVVFAAVVILSRVTVNVDLGFNVHLFRIF